MKMLYLAAALLAASTNVALAAPITYTIDPGHTQVAFTYSHFGYSNITGRFDANEGTLTYDPENPAASSIQITTRIDSVSTGVAKLDQELKGADFFDAAQFPTASFKSTQVQAAGEGKLSLTGELTIRGITLPASFDVTINKVGDHPMKGKPAAGFDATGRIDRATYGVEKYLQATGGEVKLSITIEALAEK